MKLIKKDTNKVDIIAVQGKTWELSFRITDSSGAPIDLTNAIVRGQIRRSYDSDKIADWNCQITSPTSGEFKAVISANTTSKIVCGDTIKDPDSKYVYDFEIQFPNDKVIEVIKGCLYVEWEVTKDE